MTRRYYRPLKDQTVIDTLHFIRQTLWRDQAEGLEHVDALLRIWGAEPQQLKMPRKTVKDFARGEQRRLVLEALRSGPKTGRQIADALHAARPDVPPEKCYKRTYACLHNLTKLGMVRRGGGQWSGGERSLQQPRMHETRPTTCSVI